jgi:hypothetical protein
MRKIRIIEHISLDGVIQAPGGPNEDDYPYGGWAVPHHDDAAGEAIVAAQGDAFDLLLGRRTNNRQSLLLWAFSRMMLRVPVGKAWQAIHLSQDQPSPLLRYGLR